MVIFYVYIHVYILVSDRPLSIKLTPPKGIMIETPDNMYIYIYHHCCHYILKFDIYNTTIYFYYAFFTLNTNSLLA